MIYYKKYFSPELCKRFVSDCNLPIPVFNDSELFFYFLNEYEESLGSMSAWINMCIEIHDNFNDDYNEFLKHYYDTRESVIQYFLNHSEYQEFIKADMSEYKIPEKYSDVPKGNVYKGDNIGKVFISIDLKQANFQALRYFSKELMMGADSYTEFIKKFTKSPYIINSRYFRQVVFGKINVQRQMTIEKYLITDFCDRITKDHYYSLPKGLCQLVRINNDELVFEIPDPSEEKIEQIRSSISTAILWNKIRVDAKFFRLKGVKLVTPSEKETDMFYILEDLENKGKYEYKSLPLHYHMVVHKLVSGQSLKHNDYTFSFDGMDCHFNDKFKIKKFE